MMNGNGRKNRLSAGLGIDVGGTFSDSVLIDLDTGRVLSKAKSPTTHDDLVTGIKRSVGRLDKDLFPHIRLVSLSTTLATNALVEGKKSRIAAILPGYKRALCPEQFMEDIYLVGGGHTAEGEESAPLDLETVQRIIQSTRDKVEAYAVSAYFSTRNPAHELAVQELIRSLSPDTPIACGHDLSLKLNAKRRATTTILNAHLIPIIRGLLESVTEVLKGFAIEAPLMVVKGDGSLFRKALCLARPVETILSGPAASVVGAGFLMGPSTEEAVVLDIGGTTSDIALLKGGIPKLNEDGVGVGPWQTHVAAVDVRTIGLGGDSHIRIDQRKEILIGPKRVEPLCLLGKRFPLLISQMKKPVSGVSQDPRFAQTAFYYRAEKQNSGPKNGREEDLLQVLSDGPLNIFQIAKRLNVYPISIRDALEHLEHRRLIGMSGFTPTDMFHIRGLYTPGEVACSLAAAQSLAGQVGMEMESFLLEIDEIFNRKAGLEIVNALSGPVVPYGEMAENCPACRQIWRNCFWERGAPQRQSEIGLFRMRLSLDASLIGIGAPAHILLPPLAERMGATVHVPEHAEVANALGAIVGSIIMNEQVLIRPLPPEGFACFTSAGKSVSPTIEEAIKKGRQFLSEHLQSQVEQAGGNGIELSLWEEKKKATLASGQEHLIEVVLHGQAVAKPRLQRRPWGLS